MFEPSAEGGRNWDRTRYFRGRLVDSEDNDRPTQRGRFGYFLNGNESEYNHPPPSDYNRPPHSPLRLPDRWEEFSRIVSNFANRFSSNVTGAPRDNRERYGQTHGHQYENNGRYNSRQYIEDKRNVRYGDYNGAGQ